MKYNQYDCVEEYMMQDGLVTTIYRSRYYSKYLKSMVEISGSNGLHKSLHVAIKYAEQWHKGLV